MQVCNSQIPAPSTVLPPHKIYSLLLLSPKCIHNKSIIHATVLLSLVYIFIIRLTKSWLQSLSINVLFHDSLIATKRTTKMKLLEFPKFAICYLGHCFLKIHFQKSLFIDELQLYSYAGNWEGCWKRRPYWTCSYGHLESTWCCSAWCM